MPKNPDPKSIDQLMAEADALIRQINADALKDMEESHRLEFEKHAQKFQKIQSGIQGKAGKAEILEKNFRRRWYARCDFRYREGLSGFEKQNFLVG